MNKEPNQEKNDCPNGNNCEEPECCYFHPIFPPVPFFSLLAESEREFDEKLYKRESLMFGYYKSVFNHGFESGYPVNYDYEIKSFLRSHYTRILEEVIKLAEGMKYKGNLELETNQDFGRNAALSALIALLQEKK